MKKLLFIPITAFFVACSSTPKDASEINLEDFEQRISYALGADIGASFKSIPEEIFATLNKTELEKGFYDYLSSKDLSAKDCNDMLEETHASGQGIDTTNYTMKEISHCYGAVFGEGLRKSLVVKNGLDIVNFDVARIGFANSLVGADTIIDLNERQTMIMNFHNDLNKSNGEKFMMDMAKKNPDNVKDENPDEEYIFIENTPGEGEAIDLNKEFDILLTITSITGDTLVSTYENTGLPEFQNSMILTTDDILIPQVWKIAAKDMKVGGDYSVYSSYELAFGEDGVYSPNGQGYFIQPFTAIGIHTKVLKQAERYSSIKEQGREMIEAAKQRPNTIVDPSGFVLTTLEEGTGKKVKEGDDVQAHYVLSLSNGEVIQNSYMTSAQGNQPAPSFSLNSVVKGWQLAIPKMREGGRYRLVLPYDLGYGENGNRGIQPYETLSFEIEVIKSGAPGTLVQAQQMAPQQQISPEQLKQLQEELQKQQGQ